MKAGSGITSTHCMHEDENADLRARTGQLPSACACVTLRHRSRFFTTDMPIVSVPFHPAGLRLPTVLLPSPGISGVLPATPDTAGRAEPHSVEGAMLTTVAARHGPGHREAR